MKPYYEDASVTLYAGDCLDVLATLPDNSVDAVCTDPPYGLSFMGREWDSFSAEGRGAKVRTKRAREITPTGQGHSTSGGAYLAAGVDDTRTGGVPFQQWCEQWAVECLRVLKPGGHLLAFGGTRTYHRLTCGIEDAGFEIRDGLMWVHAQGFPKSLNVGKDERFCQCNAEGSASVEPSPEHDVRSLLGADVPPAERTQGRSGAVLLAGVSEQGASPDRAVSAAGSPDGAQPGVEGRRDVQAAEGELHRPAVRAVPSRVAGDGESGRLRDGAPSGHGADGQPAADADGVREPRQSQPAGQPAGEPRPLADERGSQARRSWPVCGGCGKPRLTGAGTALKPAHEPIVVARKPLTGTVAGNVLAHGTGALNVDACRVGDDTSRGDRYNGKAAFAESEGYRLGNRTEPWDVKAGRWPSNVLLDGTAADELDRQSGNSTSQGGSRGAGANGYAGGVLRAQPDVQPGFGDSGGASRFFPTFRYEAKAPTHERPRVKADGAGESRVIGRTVKQCATCGSKTIASGAGGGPSCGHGTWENVPIEARDEHVAHPTVKPLDLMRWLVRLVTPPGGTVLEPFAGSGTTAEACVIEGFRCIAVEREPDYLPLIVARLSKPIQPDIFGASA